MKFLKNNFKLIAAFLLGVIISGGIVYATTSAAQVNYTTAKNGEVKNVADALNDLYNNKTISNTGNIEEIALVAKWISNPNTCGSKIYTVGENLGTISKENSIINCYWDSNDDNWYFKARQAGDYIIIYGTDNASITKQNYAVNDTILTIKDSTVASTYGAILVIKLK